MICGYPNFWKHPYGSWELTYLHFEGTFESMTFRTSQGGIGDRSLEGMDPHAGFYTRIITVTC